MNDVYTGQVERDPHGDLWAVLYRGEITRADAVVTREPTRSVKRGMKRVEEMILSQADADRRLSGSEAAAHWSAGRRFRNSLGLFAQRPRPRES